MKYKCKVCGKEYPTHQALAGHTYGHVKRGEAVAANAKKKQPEPGKYKCGFCSESFPTSLSLAHHVRWVHKRDANPDPVGGVPCPHCDRIFVNKAGLAMHFKRAHPGQAPLGNHCEVCNLDFNSSSALSYHKKHSVEHRNNLNAQPERELEEVAEPARLPKAPRKQHTRRVPQETAITPAHFCPNCGMNLQALALAIATANKFRV